MPRNERELALEIQRIRSRLDAGVSLLRGQIDDIEVNVESNAGDLSTIETLLGVVDGKVDSILEDTGTTLPGILGSPAGASLAADVAEVKTCIGTPAGADIATDIASVQADATSILEDTGTTIPGLIGTPTGDLVAEIDSVEAAVGALENLSSADVTAAVPTVAEIATEILDRDISPAHDTADTLGGYLVEILADTGTSIPALIAALNNLSSADVTAAVPTAAANADAVLDGALSGHTTAGSLGKAIADTETDADTAASKSSTLVTLTGQDQGGKTIFQYLSDIYTLVGGK